MGVLHNLQIDRIFDKERQRRSLSAYPKGQADEALQVTKVITKDDPSLIVGHPTGTGIELQVEKIFGHLGPPIVGGGASGGGVEAVSFVGGGRHSRKFSVLVFHWQGKNIAQISRRNQSGGSLPIVAVDHERISRGQNGNFSGREGDRITGEDIDERNFSRVAPRRNGPLTISRLVDNF